MKLVSKTVKTHLLKVIISDNLSEFKSLSQSLSSLNNIISDKSGDNSLHLCSIFNSINIMGYLLCDDCVHQIDVNLKNREEKSALHLSSQYKHLKCVEMLLKNRQTIVDVLNRSDWTPMMLALTKVNNLDVVKLLVANGSNVNLENKDGWTCFHIAVRSGDLPQIQYLLSCDSSVWRTRSKTKRTPLHTAVLNGYHSLVEFLLDNCNFDGDESDSCGFTPFMEALRCDNLDICRHLQQKRNINPFLTDILGRNGLHLSCECNALNAIRYLITELNFDVNCVTINTNLTPLHMAVKEGHIETIELLKEFGADLQIKDNKQRKPLDLAIDLKRDNCLKLLQL
ncbi:ankyrin repeat domain-containing protein 16-like [Oppia nitens]|uniref:ankyrin repeat domain-containing protein 16-like n=1 Tax=Oppia nitens TaxID=1686743 RepID=UPI0023DB328A|nr:ankyrin repeat domain-containing protein 16-like [Oppia nitens]